MDNIQFPNLSFYPKSILFVCTGNSSRSVLAKGILKKLLSEAGLEIEIESAGTDIPPGRKASLPALQILSKEGIDLDNHRTQKISQKLIEDSDLIFVMEEAHQKQLLSIAPGASQKIFLLSEFYPDSERLLIEKIPDPVGMGDFFYEIVWEMIKRCCEIIVDKLKEMKTPTYS